MREILFRGKRANGKWEQGDLTQFCIDKKVTSKISFHELKATPYGLRVFTYTNEVIPETVGQYTGLTDNNGTKIFEGDILKVSYYVQGRKTVIEHFAVEFVNGIFITRKLNTNKLAGTVANYVLYLIPNKEKGVLCEVIGNIHDNPELLESEVEGE